MTIPTIQSTRSTRERFNRRRLFQVLRAMHGGAALHFYDGAWALSTGVTVDASIATIVIADPRVVVVDFALLAETPAQTWRWVGTDLFTMKP